MLSDPGIKTFKVIMQTVILQIEALSFAEDNMFTHSPVLIAPLAKLKNSQVIERIHTSVLQECTHECNSELHNKSIHIIIMVLFASSYNLNSELRSNHLICINSINPRSFDTYIV